MQTSIRRRSFVGASALTLIVTMAAPGVAMAQSAPSAGDKQTTSAPDDQDQTAGNSASSDKDIVITGTNISGVKPVGSEAVVITRKDAEKTGLANPADIVRTLPQVRNVGDDHEGATANILTNGGQNTGINIRGLGSDATLILIDGRRTVTTGTNITTTNPNMLPLAAIDRIEVIADGTSAIYGSDAVAGVVNFVVRKDYSGVEASLRSSNVSGPFEAQASLAAGTKWSAGGLGKGNLLLSFQYSHRDNYIEGKNPLLRYNGAPLGGVDERISTSSANPGFTPNIIVDTQSIPNLTLPRAGTYIYYGLPTGSNVGLTASALRVNDPNLVDDASFTDFVGKERKYQVAGFFNQQLGDNVELFVQGNYLDRKVVSRSSFGFGGQAAITLPYYLVDPVTGVSTSIVNPYYILNVPGVSQGSPGIPIFGIPPTPPAALSVQYATLKDGVRTFVTTDKSYNITGGLRASLFGSWKGELSYTFGRDSGCSFCSPDQNLNTTALQYQVNIGAINPLSSVALTPTQRAAVYGSQTQIGHNGLDDAILKFNGPLFSLPGGKVRAAIGGERLNAFAWNSSSANTGANNTLQVFTTEASSRYSRTVASAFGELYLPVVGEDMHVPLVKSFVLSGALRYDHYTDAGQSTNPKIGFTWEVNDFLKFSGTYGTSYHAPSLAYKNPGAYSSGIVTLLPNLDPRVVKDVDLRPFGIPLAASQTALLFGANQALRPERATTWSLTGEVNVKGFRFSTTYYNIDYKDRISFPAAFPYYVSGIDAPNYLGYGSFVIPISNPTTCSNADAASADPKLQPYLKSQFLYSPSSGVAGGGGLQNFCAVRAVVDSRFFNLARAKQEGLDFNASYNKAVGEVALTSAVSVNLVLGNKEQPLAGEPFVERLNSYGTPVRWRGRGNIGLAWRGANATLFGNYYGSYTNDQAVNSVGGAAPPQKVPSYTTFDLNLGYATDLAGRERGVLKGLRGSFTVTNLFDRLPPLVINANSAGGGSSLYNPNGGLPFGRRYTFQITASF